jgi:hypothetical protein
MIKESEKYDIATVDIPGAFLQADMDEIVHMKITGTMVDMLVQLQSSKYKKFVLMENEKNVLYVKLNKALYSTL